MAMFSTRLREARERLKHSQTSLGQLLNVAPQHIQRWESGKHTPSPEAIKDIARALDVSADFLLGLTDEFNSHYEGELSSVEKEVIEAMRRGDGMEAVRLISTAGKRG